MNGTRKNLGKRKWEERKKNDNYYPINNTKNDGFCMNDYDQPRLQEVNNYL